MSTWPSPSLGEWLSYRPADFLMFSPRIYWRLFESLNVALWPAQLLLAGAALGWLAACVARGGDAAPRVSALALGMCWWLVAWAFLLERYAPINWAAQAFAAAFALQALGLLAAAGARVRPAGASAVRRRIGFGLLLWALLGHPWLAGFSSRPWLQAEVFGLAPDPTAIGTLGWLLLRGGHRALWIVPLLWCAISAATLATMGSAQAAVPIASALLALAAMPYGRRPG